MPTILSLLKSNISKHDNVTVPSTKSSDNQISKSDNSLKDDIYANKPTQTQLTEFLSYLDDGIDFGVLAIYTCPNSCCIPASDESVRDSNGFKGYVDSVGVTWVEYAVVQGPPDIA